jgi:membrane-associated phospholipid phosphatase
MPFRPTRRLTIAVSIAALVSIASVTCFTEQCRAQSGPTEEPLYWSNRWPRFSTVQWVSTSVLAAGTFAASTLMTPPSEARWNGGVLFDTPSRSLLAADDNGTRYGAAVASDVLLTTLVLYPYVIDTGLVAWGVHGNSDVALQMAAINSQSFLLTALVTSVVKNTVGRQRPYASNCAEEGEDRPDCQTPDRNRSFLSGHTSLAFTGAGLTCAHHGNLKLYGSRTGGQVACLSSLAAASTVGVLRCVADKHYTTDVLAGAALGLISGYLLPTWLHYNANFLGPFAGDFVPLASADSLGVAYHKKF